MDKSVLNGEVSVAEALKEEEYTEATWKVLEDALKVAKAVATKKDATQEEVDQALKALEDAIKALEKLDETEPSYTFELEAVKQKIVTVISDYTLVKTNVPNASKFSVVTIFGEGDKIKVEESKIFAIGEVIAGATNETITINIYNDALELLHVFENVETGLILTP